MKIVVTNNSFGNGETYSVIKDITLWNLDTYKYDWPECNLGEQEYLPPKTKRTDKICSLPTGTFVKLWKLLYEAEVHGKVYRAHKVSAKVSGSWTDGFIYVVYDGVVQANEIHKTAGANGNRVLNMQIMETKKVESKKLPILPLLQREVDAYLNPGKPELSWEKKSCKITCYIILAAYKAKIMYVNQINVYDKAKTKGNDVIRDRFWVADPASLSQIVSSSIKNISYPDINLTQDAIKNAIDNDNPVMIVLDDATPGHGEIIYGYEILGNNKMRFLVHDVGYQGDTFVDPDNWLLYKIGENGTKYSESKQGSVRKIEKLFYSK